MSAFLGFLVCLIFIIFLVLELCLWYSLYSLCGFLNNSLMVSRWSLLYIAFWTTSANFLHFTFILYALYLSIPQCWSVCFFNAIQCAFRLALSHAQKLMMGWQLGMWMDTNSLDCHLDVLWIFLSGIGLCHRLLINNYVLCGFSMQTLKFFVLKLLYYGVL